MTSRDRTEYRGYIFEIWPDGAGWKVDIAPPGGGFTHTQYGPDRKAIIESATRYIDQQIENAQ